MEYVIIWLVCGGIAAAVYNNKGRSGVTGLLGGILLGPIGLLLAIASSPNFSRCPYCKEYVKPGATVCPHCRKDLPPLTSK